MFEGTWLRSPDWLLEREELESNDKLVYSALARCARSLPYCWPFMSYLSKMLGIHERTVIRAVQRLEKLGLIEVERPEDREFWSREALSAVETSGNRYFFLR